MGNWCFRTGIQEQGEAEKELEEFIERCNGPEFQTLQKAFEQSAVQARERIADISSLHSRNGMRSANKKSLLN